MRTLEAHASILSVLPLFDVATARDVLEEASEWLSTAEDAPIDGEAALRAMSSAGLLVEWRGLFRLADPVREDLRKSLAANEPTQFRRTAGQFSVRARNGFGERIALVLGPEAADLGTAVLELVADPTRMEPLDRLVSLTQSPDGRRGTPYARAAQRQLALVTEVEPLAGRLHDFLIGMQAWRQGQRDIAVRFFNRVLATEVGDRAEAIAGHLVGVSLAASGQPQEALSYLRVAAHLLRQKGDQFGEVQALTSLGRAQFRLYDSDESDRDEESLSGAITALTDAVAIGDSLGGGHASGYARLELARVYQRTSDIDSALSVAAAALDDFDEDRLGQVESLLVVGSLYRDLGDVAEAGQTLSRASQIAADYNLRTSALARVLNVQASAERRAGDLPAALVHARESLRIGRARADRRHVAHASHTLAAVLIDMGGPKRTIEARDLLSESSGILSELGDREGLQMVARALARLPRRGVRELGPGEGKDKKPPRK